MRYVNVRVAVNGAIPQDYSVPCCDAQDFAAERYEHYRHELGEYRGSIRIPNEELDGPGVHDRFERGFIYVAD